MSSNEPDSDSISLVAYKDKLFGFFSKLHSVDEFEGVGMNLALVKNIIQKHNGVVFATSENGAGATFYFSLPLSSDSKKGGDDE